MTIPLLRSNGYLRSPNCRGIKNDQGTVSRVQHEDRDWGILADILLKEEAVSYKACPLTAESLQVVQVDTVMTQ
jgi:hypothetical protein